MAKTSTIDLSYQDRPMNQNLEHIPGELGWPFLGRTFELLSNTYGLVDRLYKRYGPVAKVRFTGVETLICTGAEANRQIYLDPQGCFSPKMGYAEVLGQFYGGGLLMRDFDDHRMHRRIFQSAFKNDTMRHYTGVVNSVIAENIARWGDQPDFHFFPHIKTTLLDVAAQLFLGISDFKGAEAQRISDTFIAISDGMVGIIRWDTPLLPFAKWRKGKEAKRYMENYLRSQIEERRKGDGLDMFSLICRETDENGNYFSDDDIAAHINFLLFAAHDTTTSNLCYIMQYLGQDTALQQRARAQTLAKDKPLLEFDDLSSMIEMDNIHHEALRMNPSVMLMNRRTTKEVVIGGVPIPPDTIISVLPQYTHMMAEHWDDPQKFDPDRFSPERAEHKRHPFQYIPFGGGAHKCIGIHFAGMIVKCCMHQILQKFSWEVPADYNPKQQVFPMPKQADDLPLALVAR
jgi:cytochrome P450